MIFGGIHYNGKTPLYVYEANQRQNAELYIHVLDSVVIPYLKEHGLIFQQDGASSHTARITMEYLQQNGIVLHWHPAKSCDQSPIESC